MDSYVAWVGQMQRWLHKLEWHSVSAVEAEYMLVEELDCFFFSPQCLYIICKIIIFGGKHNNGCHWCPISLGKSGAANGRPRGRPRGTHTMPPQFIVEMNEKMVVYIYMMWCENVSDRDCRFIEVIHSQLETFLQSNCDRCRRRIRHQSTRRSR